MTHSLRRLALLPFLAATALLVGAAHAQPATDTSRDGQPGKDVFDGHCAVCHLNAQVSHAPVVDTLRTYPAERINTALTTGVMRAQGASLSDEERDQVVAYLAAAPGSAPAAPAVSTTTTTTTTSSHSSTTAPAPKS